MLISQELSLQIQELEAELETELGRGAKARDGEIARISKKKAELRRELVEAQREEHVDAGHFATGETAEVRGLVRRATVGGYVEGMLNGSRLDGVEAELNAAVKVGNPVEGGVICPFAVLAPKAATDLSSDPATRESDPVLARVFAQSDAMHLGVRFIMPEGGEHLVPWVDSTATAAATAPGTKKAAVDGSIGVGTLTPSRRINLSYELRREDLARLPYAEDALADDLRRAVNSAVDSQVINGSGIEPNLTGFMKTLAKATDPSAVATWGDFVGLASDTVDGVGANTEMDVRVLTGIATHQFGAKLESSDGPPTAVQYLKELVGMDGYRASSHMPAVASKFQATLSAKMGYFPSAALATWNGGVELIRDPYTKVQSGLVALTCLLICDFTLFRTAGFVRGALQVEK